MNITSHKLDIEYQKNLLNIVQINVQYVEVWFREARRPSPHGVVFFEIKHIQDIATPQNHQKVVSLDGEFVTLYSKFVGTLMPQVYSARATIIDMPQ